MIHTLGKISAKSMEADVCVELVRTCREDHDAKVAILVGDDDSSTICQVRNSVTYDVEKWSDINHAKRTLGNMLYSLQSQHKNNKNISGKVIEYLQRCFSYAIKQNNDNPEGVKSGLATVVPHAFGDHSKCSSSWCGYLKDPEHYTHSNLPQGKDLQGETLWTNLEEIFDEFTNNSEKLAPLGSSQANEALNNTIGSKAPKIRHYGSSESNDFRVACAVSQKNIGHSYVAEVRYNKLVR